MLSPATVGEVRKNPVAPGVSGKVCVDAQPAMDKVWAVRAGLGWIGKHTNLITRDYQAAKDLYDSLLKRYEEAKLAASLERATERVIAAGVGAVTVATGNLAIGFAAGALVLVARGAWSRIW